MKRHQYPNKPAAFDVEAERRMLQRLVRNATYARDDAIFNLREYRARLQALNAKHPIGGTNG